MRNIIAVCVTLTTITLFALFGLLIYADKDITPLLTAASVISISVGTLFGIGRVNKKVDTVVTQTNGANTELRVENNRLTDIIISRGLDPATGEPYAGGYGVEQRG